MHSKVEAGGKIECLGKRGQIAGGEVLAGEEIRVKQLGAQASTPTLVIVGANPRILKHLKSLEKIEQESLDQLTKIEQNLRTLYTQKMSQKEKFSPEKEKMLTSLEEKKQHLEDRLKEIREEKAEIEQYLEEAKKHGKVHVEKTLFPGVTIEINNARFQVKDEYHHVTLSEENGNIKISPYEEKEEEKRDWRKRSIRRIKQKALKERNGI